MISHEDWLAGMMYIRFMCYNPEHLQEFTNIYLDATDRQCVLTWWRIMGETIENEPGMLCQN